MPANPRLAGATFFIALALVTALPLILLPLSGLTFDSEVNSTLLTLWIVTGLGHVMSTVWFGLDADYASIISAHRARMITALAALPLGTAVLVMSFPILANWAIAAYWVWLAHHYNRQNYGIMAMASAHDEVGALPKQINWVLHLSTCGGAIIMVTMPGIYIQGATTPDAIAMIDIAAWKTVAAVFLASAAALALYLVARHKTLRSSATVLLFLGLSIVFYLPGLGRASPFTTFWPYAMAHGAQYLLIMAVTARQSQRGAMGLAIFLAIIFGLGFLAYAMVGVPWAALYTGVVMWHFLVDARLWRLRDPAVRTIVRDRFNFVFRPA